MKRLVLFTSNYRKITEAKAVFDEYAIPFESKYSDINEIQHHDPAEIAKNKAYAAFEVIGRPLVINDTSWSIPALNGFPGGYMKDVNEWFTVKNWLDLLSSVSDRSILLHESIVYFDGTAEKVFTTIQNAKFMQEPKGNWTTGLERLVSVYDNKTIAQNHDDEKAGEPMRHTVHWRQFAQWYKEYYG